MIQSIYLFYLLLLQQEKQQVKLHMVIHLSPRISREQILMTFQKYGYPPHSMINKDKMDAIFKAEVSNKRQKLLNNHVLQQIWDQSQATTKGQISIDTIADIIEEAQNILQKRIDKLTGYNGMIQQLDKNIKQKQAQVSQFTKYYGEDRQQLNQLTKQLINLQIMQKQYDFDLKSFKQDYQAINSIFSEQQPRNLTQYTLPPKQQIKYQKSNRLLTLFHLTNILFLIQMIIMSSLRVSFLTITVPLHSYYLLLFGIQNPSNFTYITVHNILSVITDIIFVIISFLNKNEIMPFSHSSYHVYLIALTIILVGSIVLRVFILILYLSMRTAYSSKVIQYFVIFGEILPPKRIQLEPQYGYYSKAQRASIENQHRESVYVTQQIKEPANYNITVHSPRRQFDDYSSVKPINIMSMDQ